VDACIRAAAAAAALAESTCKSGADDKNMFDILSSFYAQGRSSIMFKSCTIADYDNNVHKYL